MDNQEEWVPVERRLAGLYVALKAIEREADRIAADAGSKEEESGIEAVASYVEDAAAQVAQALAWHYDNQLASKLDKKTLHEVMRDYRISTWLAGMGDERSAA